MQTKTSLLNGRIVDWTQSDAANVAATLAIINPVHISTDVEATIRSMQALVSTECVGPGYIATAGWCVTIYAARDGALKARCTLTAHSVLQHLAAERSRAEAEPALFQEIE